MKLATLIAALLANIACYGQTFEPVMNAALALTGQTGWTFYNGGDAPYGAYFLNNVVTNTPASITLPSTITPGAYKVFVKVIPYYTNGVTTSDLFYAEIGGGSSSGSLYGSNPDPLGRWTPSASVTVTSATNKLILAFEKAGGSHLQKALLMGVLVSDCDQCIVDRNDVLVELPETYPDPVATSQTNGPNLLANSGWELGHGGGWALSGETRLDSFLSLRTNDGHSGSWSMKLYPYYLNGVMSRPIRLAENRTNVLSVWAKAHPANTLNPTIKLRLENAYEPPSGFAAQLAYQTTFTVTNDATWRRYAITGAALAYPKAEYRVIIDSPNGQGVLVDDMQLQEGSLTDYRPADVEVGLQVTNNAIHYSSAIPTAALYVANGTDAERTVDVTTTTRDAWLRPVWTNTISLTVGAGTVVSNTMQIGTTNCGFYRISLRATGITTDEEATFVVVPPVQTITPEPIGSHPWLVTNVVELVQDLGIVPARTLSPSAVFRWGTIEATEGVLSWTVADDAVAKLGGFDLLGVLGDEYNPAWAVARAGTNETEFVDRYARYCSNVVARYGATVTTWELQNEPNISHPFDTGGGILYSKAAKAAAVAIRTVQPAATIVVGGGSGYTYTTAAIAYWNTNSWPDWTNSVDVVSAHIYPDGESALGNYTNILSSYGVEVWNTETGSWAEKAKVGKNSGLAIHGLQVLRHRDAARFYNLLGDDVRQLGINLWTSFGRGLSRYYYYDSRVYHSQDPGTHPTIIDYDDTPKVLAPALAFGRWLLDGRSSSAQLAMTDSAVSGFVFGRDGGSFAALWLTAATNAGQSVTLAGAATNGLSIRDMFGGVIGTSPVVSVGVVPIYVLSTNTAAALEAGLEAASVAALADTTAPALEIMDWAPEAQTAGDGAVRWLAMDQEVFPNDGNEDAIEYSYRFDADEWSDWSPFTNLETNRVARRVLYVRAKDESGNISATNYLQFGTAPSATANTVNVGTLNIGN